MNDMKNIIIKHVHIDGLWKKYVVDLSFDKDVNILVGDNGVGKTTIMNIIYSILLNLSDDFFEIEDAYVGAQIDFTENYMVSVTTDGDGKKKFVWKHDGVLIGREMVPLLTNVVSTFDSNSTSLSLREKIISNNPTAKSELDFNLFESLDRFYKYKSFISNLYRKLVQEGNVENANALYVPYDKMKSICDRLFKGKKWHENETDGKVQFVLEDGGEYLSVTHLSSGEKQLLILLITTLVQHQVPVVNFWDEPEISLHIEWQQQIIRVVRELNPEMQLVISTHSPSVLYEGWEQRVVNVNDIKSK